MKLAVFFPGIGYRCDKPLLYYSRKLAKECGYEETIALSYAYDGGNIRGNEEKMQQAFESLYEQAEKSLSAIAFIGTSDPWSIVPEIQTLSQKQQMPMYTYKNANHSLETTDTLENLKILQDVMRKTKGFLERK